MISGDSIMTLWGKCPGSWINYTKRTLLWGLEYVDAWAFSA